MQYYPQIKIPHRLEDIHIFEKVMRLWIDLRYASSKNNKNKVLELFKSIRASKPFAIYWPQIKGDPALDIILDHPDFIQIRADWEHKVANQSAKINNYLKLAG